MSDEESIRDPGHLDRILDQSDGSDHKKLHAEPGKKRSPSIKTLYSSGDSWEGEDNVDDLDLPVMTHMSFQRMRQNLKTAFNCVQDLTDNVDKLLRTVEELQDKIEELQQRRNTGCGFSCSNNSFAL